ncbi:FecR family protein [Achromobacter xylosoxidans]|uniref:FecR family protein n=1 Tax=Alcaligenes xylosoxydans xylosoxydans TaxID=85698 RepID=UPI0034D3E11B
MSATSAAAAREAAIAWRLCLSGGAATEADQRAFEAWFAASPLHQAAWQHLEAALGSALHAIDPRLLSASGALRRSLLRPQEAQRRRLNKLLLTAGGLVGGAVCLDRFLPLTHVAADYLTATGQRRTVALPDGAIMELDARSAASVDFSGGRRRVRLEAGAIVLKLADGAGAVGGASPLRIETAQGAVLPRSGSVLVQCAEDRSQCVALTGQAGIVSVGGQQRLLAEGEGAWFDAHRIDPAQAAQTHAAAWQEGRIEVHDEPLQRVVDALARYRPGWIRVSAAASRLRVSGLFPLDDTERALEALRHTQPITLRRFGAWLVMIDVAARQA